jgi:magnesium-transporting ATPase (P-type)
MTKKKKRWLGILTFLPILCVIIYIIFFAFYMFSFVEVLDAQAGDPDVADPSKFFVFFGVMFFMILVSIITTIGLMSYYIVHANANPKLDSNQKLIWILVLVLVLAAGIGNIVYYFVEIFPKDKSQVPN